jgi:hypothetical protein
MANPVNMKPNSCFEPTRKMCHTLISNQVVGTWTLVSGKVDPDGSNRDLFGTHPSGQLIFTDDLRFPVILNDPDTPRFASSDRRQGTEAENKAALAGALALYAPIGSMPRDISRASKLSNRPFRTGMALLAQRRP